MFNNCQYFHISHRDNYWSGLFTVSLTLCLVASARLMCDLPLRTHRYLLEPITDVTHVKLLLARQFIVFLNQIVKSPKHIPLELLQAVKYDVRSNTGYNLRRLMLLTQKTFVEQISSAGYKLIEYHKNREED
jgi:hypothetical protein